MLNAIQILSPQDASLFLKYFGGVAHILARRFSLGFQPDEEHLTSLLCELFDERGSTLHGLEYKVADLNQDLRDLGSLLQADISLEATPYNKYQERHLTQADFGLILEYSDHVDYSKSFRKGVLVQAKKLFPSSGSGYALSSRYKSFDAGQHERLSKLEDYYAKSRGEDEDEDLRRIRRQHSGASGIQYLSLQPPVQLLAKQGARVRDPSAACSRIQEDLRLHSWSMSLQCTHRTARPQSHA